MFFPAAELACVRAVQALLGDAVITWWLRGAETRGNTARKQRAGPALASWKENLCVLCVSGVLCNLPLDARPAIVLHVLFRRWVYPGRRRHLGWQPKWIFKHPLFLFALSPAFCL